MVAEHHRRVSLASAALPKGEVLLGCSAVAAARHQTYIRTKRRGIRRRKSWLINCHQLISPELLPLLPLHLRLSLPHCSLQPERESKRRRRRGRKKKGGKKGEFIASIGEKEKNWKNKVIIGTSPTSVFDVAIHNYLCVSRSTTGTAL